MADPQGGPDDTFGAIPSSSAKKAPLKPARKAPPKKAASKKAASTKAGIKKAGIKKAGSKKAGSKKAPAKAATESAHRATPAPRQPRAQTAAVPGPVGEPHAVGVSTAVTSDAEPTGVKPARGNAAVAPVRIPLAIGLTAASLGAMLIRRLRRR